MSREIELLAGIRKNRDSATEQVLADYYQSRGDLRGELLAIDSIIQAGDDVEKLKFRRERLLQSYSPRLEQRFSQEFSFLTILNTYGGFPQSVVLLDVQSEQESFAQEEEIQRLMRSDLGTFLRGVEFNGRTIDQMPRLLRSNLVPANIQDLAQGRVEGWLHFGRWYQSANPVLYLEEGLVVVAQPTLEYWKNLHPNIGSESLALYEAGNGILLDEVSSKQCGNLELANGNIKEMNNRQYSEQEVYENPVWERAIPSTHIRSKYIQKCFAKHTAILKFQKERAASGDLYSKFFDVPGVMQVKFSITPPSPPSMKLFALNNHGWGLSAFDPHPGGSNLGRLIGIPIRN